MLELRASTLPGASARGPAAERRGELARRVQICRETRAPDARRHEVRPAIALLPLALAACHRASSPAPPAPLAPPLAPTGPAEPQGEGVAVVELFTSEGCSSCPRADALLNELAGEADPRVLTLAFHVDYWDSLGWRDPFASPESTARQRAYATALGDDGVYTPEMIVNGTEAFTGSDRSRATAAIARALGSPSLARLDLSPAPPAARTSTLDVAYRVEGAPPGAVLDVALVEDGLSSRVLAGENAGRTLRHESVVRAWATRVLGPGEGTVTLRPNRAEPIVAWERAAVVGFVTQGEARPVLAGARVRLDRPRSEP
jgi:hypothetical protein